MPTELTIDRFGKESTSTAVVYSKIDPQLQMNFLLSELLRTL